jgi:hypothetical protein
MPGPISFRCTSSHCRGGCAAMRTSVRCEPARVGCAPCLPALAAATTSSVSTAPANPTQGSSTP